MMLKEITIEADVYAVWEKLPIYRIWVDDELMCERTFWIDPQKYFIREAIHVEIEPGPHALTIEQVDQRLGKVFIKKLKIIDEQNKSNQLIICAQPINEQYQNIEFQA